MRARALTLTLVAALVITDLLRPQQTSDAGAAPLLTRYRAATFGALAVDPNPRAPYAYAWPPTITRAQYAAAWCDPNGDGRADDQSPACPEAEAMYDLLLQYGIDPAIHYAQAYHETSLGRAGVGRPPIRNLHGVQCHRGDQRDGEAAVPWGNGCAGAYQTFRASVEVWARLMLREYLAAGLTTPETAIPVYAPRGKDGNNPEAYVASMRRIADAVRRTGRKP